MMHAGMNDDEERYLLFLYRSLGEGARRCIIEAAERATLEALRRKEPQPRATRRKK